MIWEFWIDVGGTFADCVARRPEGDLVRIKVLSTGGVAGRLSPGSTRERVFDPSRCADPDDFWRGASLTLFDRSGHELAKRTVTKFDRSKGGLDLEQPFDFDLPSGVGYTLATGDEAPIVCIRYLLGLAPGAAIPPVSVRLGTTRGTNALLTRQGARVAFVTTRGFGDILRIGYQNRPRLFDLTIRKPTPLFERSIEVDERITAQGSVLIPLDEAGARRVLGEARQAGIESLAICLPHATTNPAHELALERLALEQGFAEISVSHRVSPLMKIVSRGDTTVVDAYLTPILREYVTSLRRALGEQDDAEIGLDSEPFARSATPPRSSLRLMTSSGGLVSAEKFTGKDCILSGPAGGAVGFARVARAAGFERAIGFDMGGTSTDVSRFDGRHELEFETEKAGVRVVAPMIAIETVAAGGGSICEFDGVKLVVGPASAGADPGPACYGRGGPLAVTDVNFYLGKISERKFPFPLDRQAVEERLAAMAERILRATGQAFDHHRLCQGYLRVANANMTRAIQAISVTKGRDPRDYPLVAFGGAAGQHACAIARELGIRQVLIHPDAGLLSAYGMGLAPVTRHAAQGVYRPLDERSTSDLAAIFARLADGAIAELVAEGIPPERIELRRSLDLRYQGLDAFLTIAAPSNDAAAPSNAWAQAFAAEHRRVYGHEYVARSIEIVAARLEAIGHGVEKERPSRPVAAREPKPIEFGEVGFEDKAWKTAFFDRDELRPGDRILGPAVVLERVATTVLDPGWRGEVLSEGELFLSDEGPIETAPAGDRAGPTSTDADPVSLEIFNNQFAAIAERMGITLRNTASSVNVKERLDFSCAIFTASGDLVVNAPHIPVHLGAMGETVKSILRDHPDLRPGDVFVTNDPFRGGSHLPDVTVVSPVHESATARLLFLVASRAHHAEIGGVSPGSMPPFSRVLAEEGVLIRDFRLLESGHAKWDELKALLEQGPYPSRKVAENLADLAAQLAANRRGERDLGELVERRGLEVVLAYMGHIRKAAETKMRRALAQLKPGRHEFIDHLDDGTPLPLVLTIRAPSQSPSELGVMATFDFRDAGPALVGNLNANRAIVTAAVMYALRCLISEEIPLNQGVLAPIEILLAESFLNPTPGPTPETTPAVVGGNVETSQRLVDTILGAFGVAAASQGTMNNLLFGDSSFGYYETICGGSGATPQGPGADAVHVHMTNTRLTDPEVLEHRYPVRLREFSIRRGSGGEGKWRGGDGVTRAIEFLRPLTVSILSQRRGPYPPYGLAGGEPGALGVNLLRRVQGEVVPLAALARFEAIAGDVLTIQTPGGGGYGRKSNARSSFSPRT